MAMASEVMSSDCAAGHKTGVVNGTSSSVPEDDRSSNVELAGNQELGTGSVSPSLGEALVSEKAAQIMGSEAKSGSQELKAFEDVCGVVTEQPLEGSSDIEKFLGSDGRTVAGEVGRIDGCNGDGRLLEAKKKQLLDELEGGSMFRGSIGLPEERTLLVENLPDGCLRTSLKIEMIDDTAVIEPIIGPGIGISKKTNNSKEGLEGKKSKRSKKRGKAGGKPGSEKVEGSARVVPKSEGDGTKRMYSREEMEALRFVGIVKQRKLWKEIFNGLGPEVSREYLSLTGQKQQPQGNSTSEASQAFRRPHGPGILDVDTNENMGIELENGESKEGGDTSSSGLASGRSVTCDYDSTNLEDDDDEDSEDSDKYYVSIQRPAFYVEGEPDFDAGPPEDGLEYLRRVRWEAAQIPKVKVAKIDRSKLNKEQSVYMPVIPEITKCPEHLMPSKQWEDEFLADFSKLRMAFSQAEASEVENSNKSQIKSVFRDSNFSSHLAALGNLESQEPEDKRQAATDVEIPVSKVQRTYSASGSPTLSMLLLMNPVSRVSSLRKRISSLDAATELSREDCLWILALCVAIDTPLHGDTCASLRDLLRKCASLRARKEEVDDETIMLNILATISGRFFGQSDM